MLRGLFAFLTMAICVGAQARGSEDASDPLSYARGSADWMLSLGSEAGDGLIWPVNDTDRKSPSFNLYSGMPGGILLLAELAREDTTGRYRKALDRSIAGLESLRIDTGEGKVWGFQRDGKTMIPVGFYTGVAGIGWLYLELHRLTGEAVYLQKARETTESLVRAVESEEGMEAWNNSTDIVSGAAGSGLYLLRAARELNNDKYKAAAIKAGEFLLSSAISTPTGAKWKISPTTPRLYPNFSHGTAGVAYFLARLHEDTRQEKFLAAGVRGAREMESIAEISKNSCTWYHHEGAGENLWYVSWCHGPAGTARLFHVLARITKDSQWTEWVRKSARWLLDSGIPEPSKPINGYWNESVCCGTAGVGEFFLDLYVSTREPEYLKAAEKMAGHLTKVADPASGGYRWVQAENRVSPEAKDAQTGFAQGAAGFGLFFLKLHRAKRGEPAGWNLPDNPF